MKRAWALLLVTMAIAGSAMGQATRPADAETAKVMADLAAKTRNTLGIVEITIQDEMIQTPTGTATVVGMGICVKVEGEKATLITTALDPRIVSKNVKQPAYVTVPGGDKKLTAEYRSTDPETGITFITVTDPTYRWQPVRFAEKPNLGVGKQVFSVGLLDPWLGFEPYMGTAYVSARVRVPGPMVYCAGGSLTNIGSPVLTADGTAVGIVLQQLPNEVKLTGRGGEGSVNLSTQRESSCFVPSEEFGAIINNPPPATKRLPWIGVLGFEPVPVELDLGFPAVRAVKVAPNTATLSSPAAKAGLKDKEIITGIDGLTIEKFPTPELTLNNFLRVLNRIPIGGKIKLTVFRAKNPEPLEIAVEEFPTAPREADKYRNMDLGMIVRDKVALDEALDSSPTAKEKGVYVVSVFGPDSPAAKAGLKGEPEFNLITKVLMKPVANVKEFKAIVETELATGKKPINMVVSKGASTENITITPKP